MATLVIGGPNHGEIVDWPVRNQHYAVLEYSHSALTGTGTRTTYYHAERIDIMHYLCTIWVHENISRKSEQIIKLLLIEMLSYKGGIVLDSGGFNDKS